MMSDAIELTHGEARMRLNDHIGERAYFGLRVSSDGGDRPAGSFPVIELHGRLGRPWKAGTLREVVPDRDREIFGAVYKVGEQPFSLPELPGTIRESNNGLDFELTDDLTLRIAWADPETPDETLSHEQVLSVLNRHLGEQVYVDLGVLGAADDAIPGPTSVIQFSGVLGPAPGGDHLAYVVGEQPFSVPPLPGDVREYAEAGSRYLQWILGGGLILRVGWADKEGDA
jgi:hypothetical protein